LDALNTRYKGSITGWGYGAQSQIDRTQGQQDSVAGGLLAGAALLKGTGANYSFAPKSPGQMSGQVSPEQPSGLGNN
jgi:hypothetical protein